MSDLSQGAVGLNLTVANHVFIMDPCVLCFITRSMVPNYMQLVAGAGANPFLNSSNILIAQQPSIEHQAVDRGERQPWLRSLRVS